ELLRQMLSEATVAEISALEFSHSCFAQHLAQQLGQIENGIKICRLARGHVLNPSGQPALKLIGIGTKLNEEGGSWSKSVHRIFRIVSARIEVIRQWLVFCHLFVVG